MANNGNDKAIRLGKKNTTRNEFIWLFCETTFAKNYIELQTLYSILNGHHLPSIDKLEVISRALHLSIDALLDIEVKHFPQYFSNTTTSWKNHMRN